VASFKQRIAEFVSSLTNRKPPVEERTWELSATEMSAYHRALVQDYAVEDTVDDQVWADLEMTRVYEKLDQAVTPLGSQYLYALLKHYDGDEASLAKNAKAYQTFKSQPDVAARLRAALAGMNRKDAAELAGFLFGPAPATPSRYRVFYFLSAISIACSFAVFISPHFLLLAVGLCCVNVVLYHLYGRNVLVHASALKSLAIMLGCVPQICDALRGVDVPEGAELEGRIFDAKEIQKRISLSFLRRFGTDDVMAVIVDYLNLLCLFELSALCRAINTVNERRLELRAVLRAIARLDAFQGIAAALSAYPLVCVPEFHKGRQFLLTDVCHPLVNNPVPNSIEGDGMSILLTGTNMAGKTTFIKTLGANLVLAQTAGICLARNAVLPRARVRTLIERHDTLAKGQSYFFFEAAELLRMSREAEQNGREYWFILDEVFRGTNTIERVAAGAAVLTDLHRRGFVLASTHDQELANLLRHEFSGYHFSEVIDDKGARFDYRLRKGACTTRNAIKLLALAGYPKSVTEMAESLTASPSEDGFRPKD
jgi:DNA mismatch repair ATPase MutS